MVIERLCRSSDNSCVGKLSPPKPHGFYVFLDHTGWASLQSSGGKEKVWIFAAVSPDLRHGLEELAANRNSHSFMWGHLHYTTETVCYSTYRQTGASCVGLLAPLCLPITVRPCIILYQYGHVCRLLLLTKRYGCFLMVCGFTGTSGMCVCVQACWSIVVVVLSTQALVYTDTLNTDLGWTG